MRLEVPFDLRGRDGIARIECGSNEDPGRWGCHLLGLPYDFEVARGFPIVRASIEYEGEGYGAAMAWIQIIRYRIGGGDEQIEVDQPPQLRDSNMPYYCWGPNPSFFDAPSMPYDDATWAADAFLTASPDTVMSKVVQPICGFRWGYAVADGHPKPQPPAESPADAWATAKTILEERYLDWEFRLA